jgi:hypothetical protein
MGSGPKGLSCRNQNANKAAQEGFEMTARSNTETRRRSKAALGLLATALLLSACGNHFSEPPVEVTFRDSLIGAGKVLLIRNISDTPLTDIQITVSGSDNSRHAYQQAALGAHESFELGWKKLGGWEIPAGARVEIRAHGYFRAYRSQLAAE